jgi:leucyl aminopeptidase
LKISFRAKLEEKAPVVVLPVWEGGKLAADFDSAAVSVALKDFSGKNGETMLCYDGARKVILTGLGKQEAATVELMRRATASVVKWLSSKKMKEISFLFPHCKQKEEFLRGFLEGVFLTNYSFSYKHDAPKDALLEQVTFIGIEKSPFLEYYETVSEGVHFVRDLVNANADEKIEQLIDASKKLHPKVKITLFDKKELEKEKMGLILAVNRASSKDPVLIQATYKGDPKSKDHVVLVGKGITYDTGGLSIKPTDGMLSMKCDMAGAATVLGAVRTAARLGLKINVTALTPVTENCIGSRSYKLGDVYRSYSGKTVEINNTDAEGRLVLADALGYAVKELKPSCLVDLATLTGACVVALGEDIAGLFSNNEALATSLMDASDRTDELLCQIPVYADYKDAFKSDIADMVNSGGREAGAIKAALFLQEFVGNVPWAHLDIAGPAFLSKAKHYNPTKGTGFGVRLLVDFLAKRADD